MVEEVYYFTAHPYGDVVSVVFTSNINRSIKDACNRIKIKSKGYTVPKNTGAVVCYVKEKKYRGLWVLFDTSKYNEGIVVHESMHLVQSMLHPRGLPLNYKSEEAYAYLIQYVFNKITKHYRKFKKKH